MTYDIEPAPDHPGFTRWRVVAYDGTQGRFSSRREAKVRAGAENDDHAGIVRDKISRRFYDSITMTSRERDTDAPELDDLVDELLAFLSSIPVPTQKQHPCHKRNHQRQAGPKHKWTQKGK